MLRGMQIRPLEAADGPSCDAIIASLPYHFGQPEGVRMCADAVRSSQGLVAVQDDEVVGFLTVEPHFDRAAEITWMAVRADRRRRGIGRALVDRLCEQLRAEGRTLLVVLTVSPSDDEEAEPDDGYQTTRTFYESAGFVLARDLDGLWDGDIPVLMAKWLG